MKPFKFSTAQNVEDLLRQHGPKSSLLAGGTNLMDLMKKNIHQSEKIIAVVPALSSTIEANNKGLWIGAAASNSAIAAHADVLEQYPLLAKALLKGASPQIRNMATAAGNLMQRTRCPHFYDLALPCNKRQTNSGCTARSSAWNQSAIIGHSDSCVAVHPSDFCIALAALDAQIIFEHQEGRKKMAFSSFHRLPGNEANRDNNLPQNAVITHLFVPRNKFASHHAYVKIRARDQYAFALVSVASVLRLKKNGRIKDIRLASGGVAHKPWRWFESETFLMGKLPTMNHIEQAAELAVASTKPLLGTEYKQDLLRAAIIESIEQSLS